jgi:hypothetical protein
VPAAGYYPFKHQCVECKGDDDVVRPPQVRRVVYRRKIVPKGVITINRGVAAWVVNGNGNGIRRFIFRNYSAPHPVVPALSREGKPEGRGELSVGPGQLLYFFAAKEM